MTYLANRPQRRDPILSVTPIIQILVGATPAGHAHPPSRVSWASLAHFEEGQAVASASVVSGASLLPPPLRGRDERSSLLGRGGGCNKENADVRRGKRR